MEYKTGMLAKSLAGHDQNHIYVIVQETGDFVFLCDGRLKTIDKPKRKRKKHIQLMKMIPEELAAKIAAGTDLKNEDIRKAIGGKAHV